MKTTIKTRGRPQTSEKENRIIPTSIFRTQMTERLKQVKSSQKPLILTSHGYGEAAIIPLAMLEDMEAIIGAAEGEKDVLAGRLIAHDEVFANLKKKYGLG